MNFEWDGKLAGREDKVFAALPNPDASDVKVLKQNKIVWLCSILSPCNLTVRYYCLIDLINGSPDHIYKIFHMCGRLTYGGLWLEGYSYWCYTRTFLKAYADKFNVPGISQIIQRANVRFVALSYRRGSQMYPPPFGDVWDGPIIEQEGGTGCDTIHILLPAVGFNLHTAFVDMVYNVSSGFPIDTETGKKFVFYTGYENKYPTKWSEICAIVNRFFELVVHVFSWGQ